MRALARWLAGFSAVMAATSTLHADSGGDAPLAAPPPAAHGHELSSSEMAVRADELAAQSSAAYRQVLALKEKAKQERDVIKLNCVNSKLVQLKAHQNIEDSERSELEANLATPVRFDTYARLQSTATSIQALVQESKTCVGASELQETNSGVLVTAPELLDHAGPISPLFDHEIEPPAYASPFI